LGPILMPRRSFSSPSGAGRPLVLVHGGHGSWLHWVRNIEALSAKRTLWIPDLPGYGDSSALQSFLKRSNISRFVEEERK
jgi:pimeloyl-ACP methyl ester carboxylesterase